MAQLQSAGQRMRSARIKNVPESCKLMTIYVNDIMLLLFKSKLYKHLIILGETLWKKSKNKGRTRNKRGTDRQKVKWTGKEKSGEKNVRGVSES